MSSAQRRRPRRKAVSSSPRPLRPARPRCLESPARRGRRRRNAWMPTSSKRCASSTAFRAGARNSPRNTLPPEAGPHMLAAISYTKGCYVGQETIARLKSVGHVNRTLVFLRSDSAEFPAAGSEADARTESEVGTVTSSGFSPRSDKGIALGYVQRQARRGGHRAAGGRTELDHLRPLPLGDKLHEKLRVVLSLRRSLALAVAIIINSQPGAGRGGHAPPCRRHRRCPPTAASHARRVSPPSRQPGHRPLQPAPTPSARRFPSPPRRPPPATGTPPRRHADPPSRPPPSHRRQPRRQRRAIPRLALDTDPTPVSSADSPPAHLSP